MVKRLIIAENGKCNMKITARSPTDFEGGDVATEILIPAPAKIGVSGADILEF